MVTDDRELNEFVEKLRAAHGEHLVAIVLYGVAATPDEMASTSRYSTLAVLDRIRPADLRAAHDAVEEWIAAGHPPPVYFAASEIADASDVFPIEFLDMMEHRRVLYGRDPFDGLEVSTRHLRHQVEYELRGKLIRLRELYIPSSAKAERLTSLLVDSLATFAKLFRFALRLEGADARGTRREIVDRAITHFGLDAMPFERIRRALDTKKPMAEADAHECFAAYIEQIERVVHAVDRLPDA